MSERTELADGVHGPARPTGLLFEQLTHRSALSPGKAGIAVVVTVIALMLVPLDLWKWAREGGTFPLAVLYLPLGAYGMWGSVASDEKWSSPRQFRLKRVGAVLGIFFGALFVYGAYVWWWRNGDWQLPAFSLVYVLALALKPRRRR